MSGPTRPTILLAAVALAVASLEAQPAHAQLGGLLGGGEEACGDGGGLLGTVGSAATGYAVGGPAGAAAGAASGLPSDGASGGCPVVESAPLVVEGMVLKQQLELILQTAHMVTQIENMVKMRLLAGIDTVDDVAARIRDARRVAAMVRRVLWNVEAVAADFEALYPYALPTGLDTAGLAAHQAEQARLARESSRASKLVTADAVTAIEAYPGRAEALMAAAKACEGQTCAIDTNTQAALLGAEIGSQLLVMQAAHHRAAEAQLDYEQAAVERAVQHTIINWRGLDRYGGAPGS